MTSGLKTFKLSNRGKVFEYILIFFAIALSNTVFFGLEHKTEVSVLALMFMIIFLMNKFANKGKIAIKRNNLMRFLTISFSLLLSFILMSGKAESNIRNLYIIIGFNALLAFFIAVFLNKNDVIRIYVNLMTVISAISLFHFIIAVFFRNLVNLFPIKSTIQGYYYSMLYTWGWSNHGQGMAVFKRNSGPFWEPGAFQIFIVYAILMCILNSDIIKKPGNKLLVLLITLFSTQSTTGLIIMAVIMLLYWKDIIDVISENRFWHKIRNASKIFMACIILATLAWIAFSGIITDKLSGVNIEDTSAYIRLNDFKNSLLLVSYNPLFGIGFGTSLSDSLKATVGITNNSNGLFLMFYSMGFVFSVFYIFFAVTGFSSFFKEKSRIKSAILFLIFLITQMAECVFLFPVLFMFIYVYDDKDTERVMR